MNDLERHKMQKKVEAEMLKLCTLINRNCITNLTRTLIEVCYGGNNTLTLESMKSIRRSNRCCEMQIDAINWRNKCS